jgi:hypothetical protein
MRLTRTHTMSSGPLCDACPLPSLPSLFLSALRSPPVHRSPIRLAPQPERPYGAVVQGMTRKRQQRPTKALGACRISGTKTPGGNAVDVELFLLVRCD